MGDRKAIGTGCEKNHRVADRMAGKCFEALAVAGPIIRALRRRMGISVERLGEIT